MLPDSLDPIPDLPPDADEGPPLSWDDDGTLMAANDDTHVPWQPSNLRAAAWVARRYRDAEAQADRIGALFDAEDERLRERRKTALARYERRMSWAGEVLRSYAAAVCKDGTVDRVVLPHATLAPKMNPMSVVVFDEDAATAWLVKHGFASAVKVAAKVAVKELKAAASSYGPLDAVKSWRDLKDGGEGPVYVNVTRVTSDGEIVTEAEPVPGVGALRTYRWDMT